MASDMIRDVMPERTQLTFPAASCKLRDNDANTASPARALCTAFSAVATALAAAKDGSAEGASSWGSSSLKALRAAASAAAGGVDKPALAAAFSLTRTCTGSL